MSGGQLAIDFDYDERVVRLSAEIALMISPYFGPGTKKEAVTALSDRVARLAAKRLEHVLEPGEPMRCHTCDEMTLPKNRVRVAVCARCALEGRSPGSSG